MTVECIGIDIELQEAPNMDVACERAQLAAYDQLEQHGLHPDFAKYTLEFKGVKLHSDSWIYTFELCAENW